MNIISRCGLSLRHYSDRPLSPGESTSAHSRGHVSIFRSTSWSAARPLFLPKCDFSFIADFRVLKSKNKQNQGLKKN